MKTLTIFLIILLISSCNAEIQKNEKININLDGIKYPCVVAHKAKSVRVKSDPTVYYTILYGEGSQTFDDLRLIVSDFDISKDLKVDSKVNYSLEQNKKELIKCLQEYNENSLVQDLWFDMKESLDEEDETRWVEDKNGNNRPEKGFYPLHSISIENPIINTFKVDNIGAEIKSQLTSNNAHTEVTTIKWKFEGGKYIFDEYSTKSMN